MSIKQQPQGKAPLEYKIRLAQLRKEKKMSQKQLAFQIGVAQNTISQWETGQREIDNSYLKKLCALFCVSADYLLGIPVVWTQQQYEQYNKSSNIDKRELLAKWGCPTDIEMPPPLIHTTEHIDDKTADLIEQILSKPELMSLFNLLNGISPEDLNKTIKILDALKNAE